MYSKKPSYIGVELFNLLPEDLKNTPTQKLKKHLTNWLLKNPFYSVEEYLNKIPLDPDVKTDNPKHPCGACGVGVKYSAIKCTGPCNFWYHGGCVDITDKQLGKLGKYEINTWTCRNCSDTPKLPTCDGKGSTNQSLVLTSVGNIHQTSGIDTNELLNLSTGSSLNLENFNSKSIDLPKISSGSPDLTVNEIENKILNSKCLDEQDMETSLTLAAEVGNALLVENTQLREQIHNLTLHNANLTQQISEITDKNEHNSMTHYAHAEELEKENYTILARNNSLTDTIRELECQLEKEVQLRRDLTTAFEEADKEKEETIYQLENTIKTLKLEKNSSDKAKACGGVELARSCREMGIQTSPTDHDLPTSFLLSELTTIKNKQNQMELAIEVLNKQRHDCITKCVKSSETVGHKNAYNQEISKTAASTLNGMHKNSDLDEVLVDDIFPKAKHKLNEQSYPMTPKILVSTGTQTKNKPENQQELLCIPTDSNTTNKKLLLKNHTAKKMYSNPRPKSKENSSYKKQHYSASLLVKKHSDQPIAWQESKPDSKRPKSSPCTSTLHVLDKENENFLALRHRKEHKYKQRTFWNSALQN
ncbi:hypothetical protein J6590_021233 [Homalodisca vitripennis]|nr:hypothetical protein J6590_021233 [Homalodisca vitripennis]